MKRIIAMLSVLLLAASFIPAAFADDAAAGTTDSEAVPTLTAANDATDEAPVAVTATAENTGTDDETQEVERQHAETDEQIKAMDSGIGAQMRLVQLERELTRKSAQAQAVIDALNAQNTTNTTALTALGDIKAQLDGMIVQVQDAEKTAASSGNNTQDSVKAFVALKQDAEDLIKQFRETAKPLLKDADKKQLKASFEELDKSALKDKLKAIDDRVKAQRDALNADRVTSVLSKAGISDDALIQKIKDGSATPEEVRKELQDKIKALPKDQRSQAVAAVRDGEQKRRVQAMAHIENAESKLGTAQERMEERAKKLEEKGNTEAAKRVAANAQKIDGEITRLDERANKIEERMKEAQARAEERAIEKPLPPVREGNAEGREQNSRNGLRVRNVESSKSGSESDMNGETPDGIQ